MSKHDHIIIKRDKRFKPGTIKKTGNELRGHPDTMKIELKAIEGELLGDKDILPSELQGYIDRFNQSLLNPPLVVSSKLAKEIKRIVL